MKLRASGELDPELDARLVARCLDGESRAWDALVFRHERLVYAISRAYRLSDEDMGDVFQDVFTALFKGLQRLRDGRALVRWLASTTERVARTTALRRRREVAREVRDDLSLARLEDQGEAIGADLERIERQHQVRLAMAGVPDRCKRLLAALYYEDPVPSYLELSQRLGVPVGSLGPTRARCMDQLRSRLEHAVRDGNGISGA
jgi:RNA polymerase sigma factor (sigma-70 family)